MAVIGSAIVLLPTLLFAFNYDNSLYGFMAKMLLEGRLPYRDTWDQNFPGIIFIQALQILILGDSRLALLLFTLVWNLLTAYVLYRLAERHVAPWLAALAAVLYCIWLLGQGFQVSAQRDTFAVLLLLAGMLQFEKTRYPLAALCFGLPLLIRPTFVLVPLFLSVYLYVDTREVARVAKWLIIAAAPSLLLGLWFAVTGTFRHFWEATVIFNLEVYSQQSGAGSFFRPFVPLASFLPFLVLSVVRRQWLTRSEVSLIIAWLAIVCSILLSFRFSPYHFPPAIALTLLLLMVGLDNFHKIAPATNGAPQLLRRLIIGLALVAVPWLAMRGTTTLMVLKKVALGTLPIANAPLYFNGENEQMEHAGEYIRSQVASGEAIQYLGQYMHVLYTAGVPCLSRFQIAHPLVMQQRDGTRTPLQLEWQQEFEDTILRHPPRLFVLSHGPFMMQGLPYDSAGYIVLKSTLHRVDSLLSASYRVDTSIWQFTLYRRRDAATPKV